jgi:hypothetical protein
MAKSFGTALNCIDGRTQIPVTNWLKENFDVDYVDLITVPGMDKVLSKGRHNEISRLKNRVRISIKAHKSDVIAIVGHYDCAANDVSEHRHYVEILEAVEIVKDWGFEVRIIGLWVDEFWNVHVVCR